MNRLRVYYFHSLFTNYIVWDSTQTEWQLELIDTHLNVPYLFNLNHIHDSDYDHWPLPLVKPFLCSVMFMYPCCMISQTYWVAISRSARSASQRQRLRLAYCQRQRGHTVWSFNIKGRGRVHHWARSIYFRIEFETNNLLCV